MYNKNSLHWTFNHNRRLQEDFGEALEATLRTYVFGGGGGRSAAGRITSTYVILPNFYRGFLIRSGESQESRSLDIGRASLNRYLDNKGILCYSYETFNGASGEGLEVEFQCKDSPRRELVNSWLVRSENCANNLYRRFVLKGRIQDSPDGVQKVSLETGGRQIHSATYDGKAPVTCTHALFDVIPGIHSERILAGGTPVAEKIEIALMDDLEKLKSPVYVGFLESIALRIAAPSEEDVINLSGYYVYGNGMVPSYWWVDTMGNVVISQTTFATLVLEKKTGNAI